MKLQLNLSRLSMPSQGFFALPPVRKSAAAFCLQGELAASRAVQEDLQGSLGVWEAAVAARDAELVALQGALGELAYESDAAERLRAELRGAQGRAEDLRRWV